MSDEKNEEVPIKVQAELRAPTHSPPDLEDRVERIQREVLKALDEDADAFFELNYGLRARAAGFLYARFQLEDLYEGFPNPQKEFIDYAIYDAARRPVLRQLSLKRAGIESDDFEDARQKALRLTKEDYDRLDDPSFKETVSRTFPEAFGMGPVETEEFRKNLETAEISKTDMRSFVVNILSQWRLLEEIGEDRLQEADKRLAELQRKLEDDERRKREAAERQLEDERRKREQTPTPTGGLAEIEGVFARGLMADFRPEKVTEIEGGDVQTWTYLSVHQPGADVDVQLTLLGKLPDEELREFNDRVQRNLRPYGLQVIGAVMKECHHNGVQPYFRLDTNRCLDHLGHNRRRDKTHQPKNRRRFLEELRFLSDALEITVEKRVKIPKGDKYEVRTTRIGRSIIKVMEHWEESVSWETLEGQKLGESETIDEGYHVIVNPEIYDFVRRGWYTWIPDRLLTVDPHKHGEEIVLVFYCANQWKIGWTEHQGVISQPLRQILKGSGLIHRYKSLKRADYKENYLARIREKLGWMKDEKYIKDFHWPTQREARRADPLDCKVTIIIPDHHRLVEDDGKGKKLLPHPSGSDPRDDLTPERVREVREKFGLTQERFAEELGVSRRTIAGLETGTRPISKKLGSEINEFLYQKGVH